MANNDYMQRVIAANNNIDGQYQLPAKLTGNVYTILQMADGLPVLRAWQRNCNNYGVYTEVLRKFYIHGKRPVIARRDIFSTAQMDEATDMTRPFDINTPITIRTVQDAPFTWDNQTVARYTSFIYNVDSTVNDNIYMQRVLKLSDSLHLTHSLNRELLLSLLVSQPIAETMIKDEQENRVIEIVNTVESRGRRDAMYDMFTAVKIAHRNNFDIESKEWYGTKSCTMYIDYIFDCIELGYDIHNPYYACPAVGIEEAHRRTNDIISRRRQAEKREERMRELAYREAVYRVHLREYAGFMAVEPTTGLVIKTINTILELERESEVMHHCAARLYWDSPHILLSCRWPDGSRCSTIEYDQKQNKVCQNRSKFNQVPDNMKLVNDFIENNFPALIKQYKQSV